MRQRDFEVNRLKQTQIKSKVSYNGDVETLTTKLVEDLASYLDTNLNMKWDCNLIDISKRVIRIRITDEDGTINKLFNLSINATANSKNYGIITLDITLNEKSKPPIYKIIGKYSIDDGEKMKTQALKAMNYLIELIQ